jgi:hypothetical protein
MNELQLSRRTILAVGCLLLSCTIDLPRPTEADQENFATKQFVSEQGGVEVQIPAAWYVKEVPGDESYQAFLSREKVDKPEDMFQFGVSITRVKDYRRAFKFKSSRPADMAGEYAQRIASGVEKSAKNLVISMPTSLVGMSAYKFQIVSGGGTDKCLDMWLVVGIKGKEWVHALWELPCKERPSNETAVKAMMDSFKVNQKWGKKGA